jgi:hypothetical protein
VVRRPANVLVRHGRPRWGSREEWLIRSGGFEEGNGGNGDLRPSRDHVAGDLETRALSSASSSRSDPQLDGRQESAAGAPRHFSQRLRRIFR